MVFGLFKGKAKEAVNAFSGNKDYLEGMCAICALVAAAEGGISDEEYDMTINVMKANTALASSFSATEMESVLGKMTPKTATRSGRAELKAEIRQVIDRDKTGSMGQALMLGALDVADQDGIGDKEMAVLKDIATVCNVNIDKLLAG